MIVSKSKYWRRVIVSKCGRVQWTRRELEKWLTRLDQSYMDSQDGAWGFLQESIIFVHCKYSRKGTLWVGRVSAIIEFMHRYRPRPLKDGDIPKGDRSELLFDDSEHKRLRDSD
jgi:hypothetical protein